MPPKTTHYMWNRVLCPINLFLQVNNINNFGKIQFMNAFEEKSR